MTEWYNDKNACTQLLWYILIYITFIYTLHYITLHYITLHYITLHIFVRQILLSLNYCKDCAHQPRRYLRIVWEALEALCVSHRCKRFEVSKVRNRGSIGTCHILSSRFVIFTWHKAENVHQGVLATAMGSPCSARAPCWGMPSTP